ncbi:MAG: hypothetical protein LBV27_03070 [Oscillospiraceae bacterium]|jgi:hypothetical protein|nr:hypothetical protein [Oscillospiraceae bacterium]
MDNRKIERVLDATTLEGPYRARVGTQLALKRRAAARQLSTRARKTGKRSLLQCGRFRTRAGFLSAPGYRANEENVAHTEKAYKFICSSAISFGCRVSGEKDGPFKSCFRAF